MQVQKRFLWAALLFSLPLLLFSACGEEFSLEVESPSSDGDTTLPEFCDADAECPGGFSCLDGHCMPLCSAWIACPEGWICDTDTGVCRTKTAPDGDENGNPENGADTDCSPESYRCAEPDLVERCGHDERWHPFKNCMDGSFCRKGECISGEACSDDKFCCPETRHCRENTVEICRGDEWLFYRDCPDDAYCVDGKCHHLSPSTDGDADGPDIDTIDSDADIPENACRSNADCPANRICQPGYPGQTGGTCRPFCYSDLGGCQEGWDCNEDSGLCEAIEGYCRRDVDCYMDSYCKKLPGMDGGICTRYCFIMGENCPQGTYCEQSELSPEYGQCVLDSDCDICSMDAECPGGYCDFYLGTLQGCCVASCGPDNPCPGELICNDDGRCEEPPVECPPGMVYIPSVGCWYAECPACPEGECCTADTAPLCVPCEPCENPLLCGIGLEPCCPGFQCVVIVGLYGYCL